jgi:hypothetical protein
MTPVRCKVEGSVPVADPKLFAKSTLQRECRQIRPTSLFTHSSLLCLGNGTSAPEAAKSDSAARRFSNFPTCCESRFESIVGGDQQCLSLPRQPNISPKPSLLTALLGRRRRKALWVQKPVFGSSNALRVLPHFWLMRCAPTTWLFGASQRSRRRKECKSRERSAQTAQRVRRNGGSVLRSCDD